MVRFWEGSRSPSGSCGSRNILKKDNFEKFGRISVGGGVHSPSALVEKMKFIEKKKTDKKKQNLAHIF